MEGEQARGRKKERTVEWEGACGACRAAGESEESALRRGDVWLNTSEWITAIPSQFLM